MTTTTTSSYVQTTTTVTETVTDYELLIIVQNTEVWNDGYSYTWDDYNYSYWSETTSGTTDSSETISSTSTSSSTTSGTGTQTTSSSDSTSTSTSGGGNTTGYYTTSGNSYNSSNCSTDPEATSSCTVTRTGYGSDIAIVKWIPNNGLLVIVQAESSTTLGSQLFGNSSGANTIVIIQHQQQ